LVQHQIKKFDFRTLALVAADQYQPPKPKPKKCLVAKLNKKIESLNRELRGQASHVQYWKDQYHKLSRKFKKVDSNVPKKVDKSD
jgi:hypothetical protein